jgi:hypothetical protein
MTTKNIKKKTDKRGRWLSYYSTRRMQIEKQA